jgi:hypothetical protein
MTDTKTLAGRVAIADALVRGPVLGWETDDNGDQVPVYGEPMIDVRGYLAIIAGSAEEV